MNTPTHIQLIGSTLCILWKDGTEDYFESAYLRTHSPSAQNIGEKDIFGTQYGGNNSKNFEGVTILSWDFVGNYAIKIRFSDGHNTGIFSWEYLRGLSKRN